MTVIPETSPPRAPGFLLRYLAVGAWNTLFGVAVFTVLQLRWGSSVSYLLLLAVAQVVAVVQAHATQRLLVWRSRSPYLGEIGRFSLVYVGSYCVNAALLAVAVEVLHAPVLPSQYVTTVVVVAMTYAANRSWAFAHRSRPAREESAGGR